VQRLAAAVSPVPGRRLLPEPERPSAAEDRPPPSDGRQPPVRARAGGGAAGLRTRTTHDCVLHD
jgi:hypothetical protein